MEQTMLWDGSAILGDDAPEAALAAAVELNLAARVRFFAAEPGVQLVDDAEALRFIADRAYRVARARFDDEWAEQRITAYLTGSPPASALHQLGGRADLAPQRPGAAAPGARADRGHAGAGHGRTAVGVASAAPRP
ncbi:MAG: hypothetical protein M5R40_15580 [Anaerolineae bacterium]|nr:hypothetical protein [Anaerolineae bacterium]